MYPRSISNKTSKATSLFKMSRIFSVFGATGTQGGSVVKAVLSHPQLSKIYSIRAITRDATKAAALALAAQGVEVVTVSIPYQPSQPLLITQQADLNDPESVKAAIQGSNVVFGVTNFWEKASADIELAQGKAIADASLAANVSHLIWSSLPNATKITNGVLSHVSHFDSKAGVEAYIRSLPIPSTFFMPAMFISAFSLSGSGLAKLDASDPTGQTLNINIPFHYTDSKIPLLDIAADGGKFIATALLKAETEKPNGEVIWAAAGFYTPKEIVETMGEVTGKVVNYGEISAEGFHGFLPPSVANEVTENMVLIRDYLYYGPGAEEGVKDAVVEIETAGYEVTGLAEYLKKSLV